MMTKIKKEEKTMKKFNWKEYLKKRPDLKKNWNKPVRAWVHYTFSNIYNNFKRKDHKIIITGTGRAGTTFLVRLLSELEFDTGYNTKNMQKNIIKNCNAGLEYSVKKVLENIETTPYILKSPSYHNKIPILKKKFILDIVLIPIRNIEGAAKSRLNIGKGKPGGSWSYDNLDELKEFLKKWNKTLILDLKRYKIPYHFLQFPELVKDPKYLYENLKPFINKIPYAEFYKVFRRVASKTKSDYYKK